MNQSMCLIILSQESHVSIESNKPQHDSLSNLFFPPYDEGSAIALFLYKPKSRCVRDHIKMSTGNIIRTIDQPL